MFSSINCWNYDHKLFVLCVEIHLWIAIDLQELTEASQMNFFVLEIFHKYHVPCHNLNINRFNRYHHSHYTILSQHHLALHQLDS